MRPASRAPAVLALTILVLLVLLSQPGLCARGLLAPAAGDAVPPAAGAPGPAAAVAAAAAPAPAPGAATPLLTPRWGAFSPGGALSALDLIALTGFLATLAAAVGAHVLRSAATSVAWLYPLERATQARLAQLLPLRLGKVAPTWFMAAGLSEVVLLVGWATTAGLFIKQAFVSDTGSHGHGLGQCLAPAFAVALLPVTRNSVFLPLVGVPFERAIKYHIAAASFAMFLLAVRELGRGILTDYSPTGGNLGAGSVYGTVAATIFVTQVLLATSPVRRLSWELFKLSHLLLFPTALTLAIIHARMMLAYVTIPLIFWVADAALRWVVGARVWRLQLTPLPGSAVRCDVTTRGWYAVKAGQHAYIQVPAVSVGEWHAFSAVFPPGEARPGTLTFVVRAKSAGSFTHKLASLVAARGEGGYTKEGGELTVPSAEGAHKVPRPLFARLDGCYGGPSVELANYAVVVLIAGGVGITAMSGFADELATMLGAGGAKGARNKPRLVAASLNWSLRQPADPDAWMPGLLPRLSAVSSFTVRVAVTRSGDAGISVRFPTAGHHVPAREPHNKHSKHMSPRDGASELMLPSGTDASDMELGRNLPDGMSVLRDMHKMGGESDGAEHSFPPATPAGAGRRSEELMRAAAGAAAAAASHGGSRRPSAEFLRRRTSLDVATRGAASPPPPPSRETPDWTFGRLDVPAAVDAAVATAAAAGHPASRVAVLVCGPGPMVASAQESAALVGAHFHSESFNG